MNWTDVIQQIDRSHSFLPRLGVCLGDGQPIVRVPGILKVSTAISIRMLSEQDCSRRVALVFPKNCGAAGWTATGAALALMHNDALAGLRNLKAFAPGDRVIGDKRYIAEYVGTEVIKGEEFLVLKLSGESATYKFPAKERLRLQPTNTNRPLSSRPMPRNTDDPLDGLLGIGTMGNRSIYRSSVVLVSPIGETREWGHKTLVTQYPARNGSLSTPLVNLFQWGGIDYRGEATHWSTGQLAGRPVVTVASDLLSVEEYLTGEAENVKLVILDGSSRFTNDLQVVDDITESGIPALAILGSGDTEDAKLLRDRGFEFWVWSLEDIADPASGAYTSRRERGAAGPFHSLQRSLTNFREFAVSQIDCSDEHLQRAEESLFRFERLIGKDHEELGEVVGQLYGCLLSIARMLRPRACSSSEEWRQKIEARLKRAEEELTRNRFWFPADAYGVAVELIGSLKSALYSEDADCPKLQEFERLVTDKITAGAELLGVIVGSVDDVSLTSRYWEQRLADCSRIKFFAPSTFEEDLDYDALIISGWLGAKKMASIMESYSAPEIHILANNFEGRWLGAARRRSQRISIASQPIGIRTKLLGVHVEDSMPSEPPPQPEPVSPEEAFDITEFELRLRARRRQALAAAVYSPGEGTVQARLVGLAGGFYAFLAENYHVPVVTGYIRRNRGADEIPQKTVDEIRPGDFLLFRESSEGNLIRAVADMGLAKRGRQGLRKTVSLWRDALRAFYDRLDRDPAAVIKALREYGCQKKNPTIFNWLYNDSLIAPRDFSDIEVIALATDDHDLNLNLSRVQDAIREVRGAHLQASDFLIKKLLEAVPTHLSEQSEAVFTLEIEGVGSAVVAQVEEIAEELVPVGYTRVNRLLKEVVET